MKKIVFLSFFCIILFSLAGQNGASGSVPFYRMDLEVFPGEGRVEGVFEVTFPRRAVRDGTVYFGILINLREKMNPHLLPVLQETGPDGFSPSMGRMKNIRVNGREAAWQMENPEKPVMVTYNQEKLLYSIRVPHGKDDPVITFDYSCRLSHGPYMDDFFYNDLMVSRFGWFPFALTSGLVVSEGGYSFPHFQFEARVSVPDRWTLVPQQKSFSVEQGRAFIQSGSPVVSFPMVLVKNYNVIERKIYSGKHLRVFYTRHNEEAARITAQFAEEVLEYYKELYFPLHYNNISIIQGTKGSFGMAGDSVVIIGDGLMSRLHTLMPDFFTPLLHFMVVHELGHFYFGIGSPPDFARENYLSEGLNEYSSIKYIESKYGIWNNIANPKHPDLAARAALPVLDFIGQPNSWRGLKYLLNENARFQQTDSPLSGEPEDKWLNTSSVADYHKSSLIFRMLACYLGKERFDKALAYYLKNIRFSQATTEKLIESLESFYGVSPDIFFKSFVYGNKPLDYSLSGKLNRKEGELFISEFTITRRGADIFIPVTLSVMLEGGEILEYSVLKEGTVTVKTGKTVRYAGVDKDIELYETNRKNNFYPPPLGTVFGNEPWLNYDGSVMWIPLPEFSSNAGAGTLTFGLGPYFYDNPHWSLFTVPLITAPTTEASLEEIVYGGAVRYIRDFSGGFSFNINGEIAAPGVLKDLSLGLTWNIYSRNSYGQVGKMLNPFIILSTTAGLGEVDFGLPGNFNVYNDTSLTLNNLNAGGTVFSLLNRIYYYSEGGGIFEDLISFELTQGFSFIPRILLGLDLRGDFLVGTGTNLTASNEVTGWAATAESAYDLGLKVSAGIPFINGLDIPYFNMFLIQSINGGLFYDAAVCSGRLEDLTNGGANNLQQAAGVVFHMVFRSIIDLDFPISMGFSFNLTKISAFPGSMENYYPAFFIETDLLSVVYSMVSAY